MTIFNSNQKYEKILFNNFWEFYKSNINYKLKDFLNESFLTSITLPHDFLIYNVNNLYETAIGWYKKKIKIDNIKDFEYFIDFDGVYQDSVIYINNQEAFSWKNGYTSFKFNLTNYLKTGINNIIVKVKHESPNSRWYSGAGIFRDVYLIKKTKSYIDLDGIYINIKKDNSHYNIKIDTNTTNSEGLILKHEVIDGDNKVVEIESIITNSLNKQKTIINNPILWDVCNPYLYKLKTTLINNNVVIDKVFTNIGFKDVRYDLNEGLFLNNTNIKLNGVCLHHDLGSLGSAFNKEILKNRFKMLKEMGVNAIRTAHSVPAKEFMDACDEMGFLVVSEAFDMWLYPKTEYDYARFFNDWLEKDIKSWVTRDRNHVSLLMWSIGNEIYDTNFKEGLNTAKRIDSLIKKYDYYQNGVTTIGSNFMTNENAIKISKYLKFAGYNYAERLYLEHKDKYPELIIYGSETSSTVQSRGKYHFPASLPKLINADFQTSSLGNSTTSWGADSINNVLTIDRDIKFSLGQFIWTGYDYIGEPTPYKTKNSYFGQIDTAGFEKDSYYMYKAAWHNYKETPVIHLMPYWDFNEGEIIDVGVITNTSKIKLFLNDEVIGVKDVNIHKDNKVIHFFKVPFEKGILKVKGYDENNIELASMKRASFLDPYKFKTTLSKDILVANNKDILELTIETIDKNNNLVENDNSLVKVITKGPIKIVGIDNGDSTDYSSYKGNFKQLFSGKLKVLIGSTYEEGDASIILSSDNILTKTINIKIKKTILYEEDLIASNNNYNIRSGEVIKDKEYISFIPIRKIELSLDKPKIITKSNNHILVNYAIYPENYTKQELSFKILTEKGIRANNAFIKMVDKGLIIEGVSDGRFVLNVMANNLKKHPDIISTLTFDVNGLGVNYKNPYHLVSASTYDKNEGKIKSGNELGVAVNNKTVLIYENIDFGLKGTNKVTLPIFSFNSNPLKINLEIYDNDFVLIEQFNYYKETIWDTYLEEDYKLSKIVKGIKTLKISFTHDLHFKGFLFYELDDSNQLLNILDSSYYGDNYTKVEDGFNNIGNNVSFIYENLRFKEDVDLIEINGQSNIDINNIRLQITDENDKKDIYELSFEKTNMIISKQYKINKIKGIVKLELIFLPGSNFNLRTIKLLNKGSYNE